MDRLMTAENAGKAAVANNKAKPKPKRKPKLTTGGVVGPPEVRFDAVLCPIPLQNPFTFSGRFRRAVSTDALQAELFHHEDGSTTTFTVGFAGTDEFTVTVTGLQAGHTYRIKVSIANEDTSGQMWFKVQ
jgi:hypothetical protein